MTTTDPTAVTDLTGLHTGARVSVRRSVPGQGAACADVDAEVREAFFSTDPVQVAAAREVCVSCPVQLRCLAGALARDEQWGVWGGWVFEPRIMRTRVLPAHYCSREPVTGDQSNESSGGEAAGDPRWLVLAWDLWARRRVLGWFATYEQAVVAAERAAGEGRSRARIGHQFATIQAGLEPDHEPVRTPTAPIAKQPEFQPRKKLRRRPPARMDGVVQGRLDELINLLIARLTRDEDDLATSGQGAPRGSLRITAGQGRHGTTDRLARPC